MRRNPLYRALRPDKVMLAALDACFELYLLGRDHEEIPVVRALTADPEALRERSLRFAARLEKLESLEVSVVEASGAVGGGAAPQAELPGWAVALNSVRLSASAIESRLRGADPPVISHVVDERVLLDLRMVPEDEEDLLAAAVAAVFP
jgi:L-seryl-tRNA(Ser) seleniumtransferase